MDSRSRIRWRNVARLAAGAIAGVVLLVGLPSLIRRPEPPPLEPDIGLAPAFSAPTRVASELRPRREPRHEGRRDRVRTQHARHPDGRTRALRRHHREHLRGQPPPPPAPRSRAPTQTVYASPPPAPSPSPPATPPAPGPPPQQHTTPP